MPEFADYDRKCCLIFCFTAIHITNCLAAIHSFTRSVNNYSVKSDGTLEVTKASLWFSARSCQAGIPASLKGKPRAGRERPVEPPKGRLGSAQVKFVCLLGARTSLLYYYYVPLGDWCVCVADIETSSASPGPLRGRRTGRDCTEGGMRGSARKTLAPLQTCNHWERWRLQDCKKNLCLFSGFHTEKPFVPKPRTWGNLWCIRSY